MKEVQGTEGKKISQNTHFVMESCHSYTQLIDLVHKVHHNYFIKYNPTTPVLQPDVSCRGWLGVIVF